MRRCIRKKSIFNSYYLPLSLSFIFFLFSSTGSYSIQSIIIPVFILFAGFIVSKKSNIVLKSEHKVLLLLFIIILISTLINTVRYIAVASLDNIIGILYIFLIISWYILNTAYAPRKKDIKLVLGSYMIATTIMSIQIIIMSLRGASGKIMPTNFAGILMDENYVTATIAPVPIYILSYILNYEMNFRAKLFLIILLSLNSVAILLAGSRAALFALLIGFVLTIIVYLKERISMKKMLVIMIVALLGLIVMPKILSIIPEWTFNRYFNSNYMDNSNTIRLKIWKNALAGISQQPVLGYGMGTFPNLPEFKYTAGKSTPAHHTILDFCLYGGILGSLLFVYYLILITIKTIRSKNTRRFIGIIACLLMISLILSATKCVFLWNNLIILSLISSSYERSEYDNENI